MGLFDFLGKSKAEPAPKKVSDREIGRLARLVGDKLTQNYDRQEAIEELSKIATSEACAALLKRFDFTMDPSITDQEEKESALRGIVAAGRVALVPVRDCCARAESITWPLKALRQIVGPDEIMEELLGILDGFDTEYVRNAEPKLQLINSLAEHPSPDVREAVEPFLEDMSEPVRFAAATTVYAMNDVASLPALLSALSEDESLRVKNRIAQGLVDRGWEIPEEDLDEAREALPGEFSLSGRRVVRDD